MTRTAVGAADDDGEDIFANLRTPGSPNSKWDGSGEIIRHNNIGVGSVRYIDAMRRRQAFIAHIAAGMSIDEALSQPDVNVGKGTYKNWRKRWKSFAAEVDIAKAGIEATHQEWSGTHASFALRYFDFCYAPFQLMIVEEMERTLREYFSSRKGGGG